MPIPRLTAALLLGLIASGDPAAVRAEEPANPPAAAADPAAQDKPADTGIRTTRSKITDGSYAFDESGQLRMEIAFEGEEMFLDLQVPAMMVAKSGMPQAEFLKAAAASGVRVRPLSDTEFMVGEEKVAIFVDGKLARIRK